MGGIATRVVSPVSKLVNPQHVQPVHPKGHGPTVKKKTGNTKKYDQEEDKKDQLLTNSQLIATSPLSRDASFWKAAKDKSMEFVF
jgi:hypothetical protein